MADVVFNIRANDEASDSVRDVTRALEHLEAEMEDINAKRAQLRNEGKLTSDVEKELARDVNRLSSEYAKQFVQTGKVERGTESMTREQWEARRAANAQALATGELRQSQRKLTGSTKEAERATSGFRRAQGRLATNIRNNRTVFLALSGIIGFGGAGFVGRVTGAARESKLLADTIGVSTGRLLANRLEYEKIGKTATDYRNVLTNVQVAVGEAEAGSERHIAALEATGYTIEDILSLNIADIYDVLKEGADSGAVSVQDLNVLLRKESIPTFQQVGKASGQLSDNVVEDAAKIADVMADLWAGIETEGVRAFGGLARLVSDFGDLLSGELLPGNQRGVTNTEVYNYAYQQRRLRSGYYVINAQDDPDYGRGAAGGVGGDFVRDPEAGGRLRLRGSAFTPVTSNFSEAFRGVTYPEFTFLQRRSRELADEFNDIVIRGARFGITIGEGDDALARMNNEIIKVETEAQAMADAFGYDIEGMFERLEELFAETWINSIGNARPLITGDEFVPTQAGDGSTDPVFGGESLARIYLASGFNADGSVPEGYILGPLGVPVPAPKETSTSTSTDNSAEREAERLRRSSQRAAVGLFNFQQGRAADTAFANRDFEAFDAAQMAIRDLEIFLAQFADTSEETALRVARANDAYDNALVKFTDTVTTESDRLDALNQRGYDRANELRANDYLRRALSEGRFDDASLCLLYTSPSPRDS